MDIVRLIRHCERSEAIHFKNIMKQPTVYILANKRYGTLYTGVTSNLIQRIAQHRIGEIKGFSQKYNCNILVFYELHETMEFAILREKQIKGGSRNKKINLIEVQNPKWQNLYEDINK